MTETKPALDSLSLEDLGLLLDCMQHQRTVYTMQAHKHPTDSFSREQLEKIKRICDILRSAMKEKKADVPV